MLLFCKNYVVLRKVAHTSCCLKEIFVSQLEGICNSIIFNTLQKQSIFRLTEWNNNNLKGFKKLCRLFYFTWQSRLQYHWFPQPAHTNWADFWLQPWHRGTSSPPSELLSELFCFFPSTSLFSSITNLSALSSVSSSSCKTHYFLNINYIGIFTGKPV